MLIGVYQGAETSQNGIVENLENLIVDYLCHQHDKFKDKLKFSFTQQNLFNRLFDYFDSDKLQEVILSLLNSIPKKRNSNEIRQWYNSIREIVELVFKNPDGTIPRKIQYGLGKSYCYTIASSMPEGWDLHFQVDFFL